MNANQDRRLNTKLFLKNLPTLAVLAEGRIVHYNEYRIELKAVLKFAKNSIPNHVTYVDDANVDEFLSNAIRTNRVAVLMFGKTDSARLRYVLLAYKVSLFEIKTSVMS